MNTRTINDTELRARQDRDIVEWLKLFGFLTSQTQSDLIDESEQLELMLFDIQMLIVKLRANNFDFDNFAKRIITVLKGDN